MNALGAFKSDLWALITQKQYQSIVAIFALQLGLVALYDGRSFVKVLVTICISAIAFCMVLSQLRTTWVEGDAAVMKYVAALEVGVFIGVVGHKGWEGTQLLLGFAVGMYIYHNIHALALQTPYIQKTAAHSTFAVVVAPLMVAVGSWMTHERYGAARVFGVLAPLFGSSLLVATAEYALVFACTIPGVGKALNLAVAEADVPSVFEFWYMLACPMHSEAVGYFKMAHKNLNEDDTPIELDRVLGIFFCLLIFACATSCQLKADREARNAAKVALQTPLLSQDSAAKHPPKTF